MVFDVYKFIAQPTKSVGEDVFDPVDHNNLVDNVFKVTNITSANSPYTVLDSDRWINCDTSGGSITINLPAANNGASKPRKRLEIIKTHASNSLILDGNASETIDGSTTKTVTSIYDGWILASDGTNWIYPSMSGGGSGETNTYSTVGTGEAWTKTKVGVDMPFKSFIVNSTLSLTSNTNDLTLGVNESNLTLSNIGGTVPATKGGTAQTTLTTGDTLYASAANTFAKRGIGTTGQVYTVVGGVPAWADASLAVYGVGANYLDFEEISAPATPSADTARLFAIGRSGRTNLAYKNDIGRTTYLSGEDTYSLARRWYVGGGSSTASSCSVEAPVSFSFDNAGAGTGTLINVGADTDGGRKRLGTGATISSEYRVYSTLAATTRNNNPRGTFKFKLSATTNVRIWMGFFEGAGSAADPMAADSTAAQEKVAFRYSSTQGNANWNVVNCDGTTENVIQLSAADTSIHEIFLEIDDPNSRMFYSLDRADVTSSTANLPANGTALTFFIGIINLSAADKLLDFWWYNGASDE